MQSLFLPSALPKIIHSMLYFLGFCYGIALFFLLFRDDNSNTIMETEKNKHPTVGNKSGIKNILFHVHCQYKHTRKGKKEAEIKILQWRSQKL